MYTQRISRYLILLSLGAFTLLVSSCSAPKDETQEWVEQVNSYLEETEGGQWVADAIRAHGGLDTWLSNQVLQFRWTYHMSDLGPDMKISSLQRVDTSSYEAAHEISGSEVRFGWTGEDAWIYPPDSPLQPHPRFWSLTPYYFVGIPFVFADLNAQFEKLPTSFDFEGNSYQQVKVTYNANAGDSPDDYYILLIDPGSKQVVGARYIVTSPLVAPNGPLPEKLITLEGFESHGGILLPTKHRTFNMVGDQSGEHIRDAEATDYNWLSRAEVDFSIPDSAKRL